MKRCTTQYKYVWLASTILCSGFLGYSASAQDTAPEAETTEVVVTGSRFGRVAVQSATPIDVIKQADLDRAPSGELKNKLKTLVPSFSINTQFAGGAQDFMAGPSLRGLSAGQMLLLVNGKRRFTSATINGGSSQGRGDITYDFNAIPPLALSRVEVLRDGAAAQYGSDAIAGVINMMLDESVGLKGETRYGKTSQGDGEQFDVGVAAGYQIGDGGVIRFTVTHQDYEETNRALPDTRQQYFGSNGTVMPSGNFGSGTGLTPSAGTLDPREATIDRNLWVSGEPAYINNSVFVNAKLPLSNGLTAYGFGGYNKLDGTSFNFFRRAGQDETVRAIYPNGFMPLQMITLTNYSAAAGIKGDNLLGFNWDLSTTYGGTKQDLAYSVSANVSIGASSQTNFYRGSFEFEQWTTNFDLNREFDMGASPLKLALGAEFRTEDYATTAGEPNAYLHGGVAIADGPNAGKPAAAGAQPGGGIRPEDALTGDRNSYAVYGELEKTFFERWMLSAAVRHEDFSDFGTTDTYKLATRFEITPAWSLRGSVGSGFRAPSLAQSYFASTNVTLINGQMVRTRIVSTNDPIAPLIGGSPLDPEKSENLSIGSVLRLGSFTGSIDYYKIEVSDRIVLSSNFSSTALTTLLANNGQPNVNTVSYLTNAVDTTTEGVDIVGTYRHDLGKAGKLSATLALNFNETTFDSIAGTPSALTALGITTTLFDLTQQKLLSDSRPKEKGTLSLGWSYKDVNVNLTSTYYGKVSEVALTGLTKARMDALLLPGYDVDIVATGSTYTLVQNFRADTVTDLDINWAVNDHFGLSFGAANIFDKYPAKRIASTKESVAAGTNGSDNAGTLPYAYIAPYGTAGRRVYVKLSVKY